MGLFQAITSTVVLFYLATLVSAHGFVTEVVIDGKTYPGSNGADASASSPVRKVSSGSPVFDATSKDIICGLDSQLASGVATAKSGSVVQFFWKGETGINWFHTAGPILTYMTKCAGSCSSFTPSSSSAWFKIAEAGEKQPGTPNTWAQADLTSGAPANVTLPSDLAPGNYLIRHEIIALQNAQIKGGAEYYPSCLQVTVSGSGSGSADATVHFPGAYTATDPGLLGNFYNPGVVYTFPGGPVAKIGVSSSSPTTSVKSTAPSSTKSSSSTSSTLATSRFSTSIPTPTSSVSASPTPSSSKGRCGAQRRRRRSTSNSTNTTTTFVTSRKVTRHHKRRLNSHH